MPLVGEITYNRGNEEFVGGRGDLRRKGCKIGEMLENVRELIRNCLIENRIKIKDQLYSTKLQNKLQIQVTQNCVPFKRYFAPLHRNMACNLVCSLHAELSIFI